MKRTKIQILLPLVILSICILAVSISIAGEKPDPDAENLWTYITEKYPYEGWGFWPGQVGIYPGQSPHGAYLKLYANPVALKAAREGKPLPDGSILVKENYAKDKKTLMAVTPMYKVEGYNPEAGNWFWAKYGKDGKAMVSGKVDSCINCHKAGKAGDYLFTETK